MAGWLVEGARIRVGRAHTQVRGGAGAHVVAGHARAGLPLPVSTPVLTLHYFFFTSVKSVSWCCATFSLLWDSAF